MEYEKIYRDNRYRYHHQSTGIHFLQTNQEPIAGGSRDRTNENVISHNDGNVEPDFEIIDRNVIFDRDYIELLVDIPRRYWTDISLFFKEKKNRLIYLLKHHVNLDDIETFGFMIRFKDSI